MSVVNDPALWEYSLEKRVEFDNFHRPNPHIFRMFRDRTFAMWSTGRSAYGARTIIENMRWDHDIVTTSTDFKINDDWVPMYARLMLHRYPKIGPFFHLRKVGRARWGD